MIPYFNPSTSSVAPRLGSLFLSVSLMASLPTAQFLPLFRTFSGKSCPPRVLVPSLNSNRRTDSTVHFTRRVSNSNCNAKPAQATLNSSSITEAPDIGERTLTLREICQGCVPEHVLRRRVLLFLCFLYSCVWLQGKLRKKKKIIAQFYFFCSALFLVSHRLRTISTKPNTCVS